MARLEIDIALNNLQGATTGLKTLQDSLKQLSGKGVNIDSGKAGLSEARIETEKMRKELIQARIEKVKLSETRLGSLSEYQKLSRELTSMRNEAKDLGAQMIKLEAAGLKSSVTYNTLSNRFKNAQNQVLSFDKSVKRLDQSLGQSQRFVGQYERGMGNASGVTMEFNRIIQDAPFGMMGIGNNIQQLAVNWQSYTEQAKRAAAETGKTLTTMSLVKGVMSSMLSPANLLTLGIAAATSAWTAYTMWQQKANKEMKNGGDDAKSYAETLGAVARMQLEGSQNAQKELVQLQLLKKVYDDSATSQEKRKQAYNGILDIYTKYFPDVDKEQIKIGNLDKMYKQLSTTILATAKARAAENIMIKNSEKMLENDMRRIDLYKNLKDAQAEYNRIQKQTMNIDTSFGGGAAVSDLRAEATRRLTEAQKAYFGNVNDNKGILEQNNLLTKDAVNLLQNQAKVTDATTESTKRSTSARQAEIKVLNNYLELLKEISSISGLGSVDYSTLGKVGIDLEVGKVKAELDQVLRDIDAYKTKVLNDTTISEAQRTNLIAKANADREILEGRHLAKMQILQQDYTKRIEEMTVKPVKTVATMDEIQSTEEPEWMKKQKELTRAIKSEINNILNMLPNLSGGFSDIFSQLTNGLNDILQKALVERLGEMITKKMKQLDDETQMIVGALAVAGKTLQGLFSKTSGVGQGLGGAASGAGAGLGIGSMLASTLGASAGPWGAAIGGAIGLVSGIIGAKKAKKQEEMQRKQLEEQKKANALLERMNALAYTSSIIGGQSQYGIVSGVNRNAQGEFTFKIDGRDLVAVMGNNERLIGR